MSTPKRLIDGVELVIDSDTEANKLIYTSPANTKTVIKSASICETAGNARTVNMWIAESGNGIADSRKIYSALAASANSTQDLSSLVNKVLEAGDKIYADSDAASEITLHLSGSLV